MRINKTFLTMGLAAALLQMPATTFANISGSRPNPLLTKSTLPFGAPDFSKIQESDYLPAIEAAIKSQRENIQKIVTNKQKPTFKNTILAFEESGVLLDRVTSVFFGLTSAHKTSAIAETQKKVSPMLTQLSNEISFNKPLFERIKYVYDHDLKKLKGEDQRLTEDIYKNFVRSGALLSEEKMNRMKQINSRISELQQQWGNLLPAATNAAVVWVNSKEELAGLSDADIAQCQKDNEIKPYFNIDSVQVNGVFYAAHRVYGLNFKQRKDIPTYHPGMKVFEVSDKNGKPIALFYSDYFRRPTKRGGAWMSSFAKQSKQRGQLPIIYNVCNYAKAPEGQPSLITWDEACTLFHEFGHTLHGILSDCQYNTLSGTAVARDFVEMPSQFNESFASIPEIFDHFARHTETGKPMPAELKDRMLKSINFQTAYALGENLAATCLDLAWHELTPEEIPSPYMAGAFEKESLHDTGLLDRQIPPRYSTSYFNHVWGGGYAAGYYSYLWTEVLAVNIADYFAQHGALDPAVGQAFRDKILRRGNTKDQLEMFTDFTGMKQPDASRLLKARGL